MLERDYYWENLNDIEEDIMDWMDNNKISGEFTGAIKVVVIYEPEEE